MAPHCTVSIGYCPKLKVCKQGTFGIPTLLAQIDTTNRKPKRQLLLGLGEPFEPNPWDISEDHKKDFLMVSQMAENELSESKPHSSDWKDPLNRLLNSISFVKMASRKAPRSKRTGLFLCGLSGRTVTPRILSRLMNVCTAQTRIFSHDRRVSISAEQCASNLPWAEQGSKISQLGGY